MYNDFLSVVSLKRAQKCMRIEIAAVYLLSEIMYSHQV